MGYPFNFFQIPHRPNEVGRVWDEVERFFGDEEQSFHVVPSGKITSTTNELAVFYANVRSGVLNAEGIVDEVGIKSTLSNGSVSSAASELSTFHVSSSGDLSGVLSEVFDNEFIFYSGEVRECVNEEFGITLDSVSGRFISDMGLFRDDTQELEGMEFFRFDSDIEINLSGNIKSIFHERFSHKFTFSGTYESSSSAATSVEEDAFLAFSFNGEYVSSQ